jgi:flagellar basal-body rod modification protein FlgD
MSSQIAGLGTTSSSFSTSDPHGSSKLGKDEFLKLLLSQLANQDPTAPSDSKAFVAQLAQFASLEQMQSTNNTLESLLIAQTSSSQINAVSLVGKDALFQTSQTHVTSDGGVELVADLSAASACTTLVVTDSLGKQVAKVDLGPKPAGKSTIAWNGIGSDGAHVPAGDYTLTITASDRSGKNISLDQTSRRRIDGVSFKGGSAELLVGSDRLPLYNVLEIVQP